METMQDISPCQNHQTQESRRYHPLYDKAPNGMGKFSSQNGRSKKHLADLAAWSASCAFIELFAVVINMQLDKVWQYWADQSHRRYSMLQGCSCGRTRQHCNGHRIEQGLAHKFARAHPYGRALAARISAANTLAAHLTMADRPVLEAACELLLLAELPSSSSTSRLRGRCLERCVPS